MNVIEYQQYCITYKRISGGGMASHRLSILINNKFGKIPLDETKVNLKK